LAILALLSERRLWIMAKRYACPYSFSAGKSEAHLCRRCPDIWTNRVLDNFGGVALLLFPLSLLVTAGISALYVGRSLAPIKELTRHAALMAKRVTNRQGFWTPLPVAAPHDELGRLAQTFNHLLKSVDSAVLQLRQFVTDASHELRTPLAVLHGETELMLSNRGARRNIAKRSAYSTMSSRN